MRIIKKLALAASMLIGVSSAYAQEIQAQTSYPQAYTTSGNFFISWAYRAVNRDAAMAAAVTGKGVTVAVYDTGINPANVKFSGNLVTGWNLYCNNGSGCTGVTRDNQWHGTFVSSIIAANMRDPGGQTMYGMATDAKIMPIQILDSTGAARFTDLQLGRAINYAANNGARIHNNSWNSSLTLATMGSKANTIRFDHANQINAWRNAAAKGQLIVFAAGNFALKDPGFYATMPSVVTGLDKNWITVVATDQTGALASYSNACGIAAAYCMAAPGSNIIGLHTNSIGIGSGTSFAAPIVSGAAALLLQYFPHLKGSDIQRILFTTADKSGIYANTAIYGQGMLDLTKAFQPIGTLQVATTGSVTGASTSMSNTFIAPSGAFGSAIQAALQNTTVMVLDDFKRDYYTDLGSGVIETNTLNNWSDQMAVFGINPVKNGDTTSMSGQFGDMSFGFNSVEMEGLGFTYANNVSPSLSFGPFINDSIGGGDLVLLNSVGNPYMNMAPDSSSASMSYKWNEKNSIRVGLFSNTIDDELMSLVDPVGVPNISGAMVENTTAFKNGYFTASVGFVNEQNSVLGTVSDGALSLGANANTVFAGINAGYNISESVSIFGGANIGYTMVDDENGSMISDVENLSSANAYVGLTKTGIVADNDRFGLVAGLPLRVNSGTAELEVPVSRDIDGNVSFNKMDVALNSDDIQFSLQGFYTADLDENQSLQFGVGVVFNTSDIVNDTELVGMARYNLNF